MKIPIILMIVAGLLFYGHFLENISQKTSIPDILGLVLLGILAGPVFKWVDPEIFGIYGSLLSTLVLALILYISGTSLKIEDLKKYIAPSMGVVYAGYFITSALVSALCLALFDITLLSALYIGTILGGTSAAVVIVFIKNLQLKEQTTTTLIIESAKTDIFTFVFPYTILGIMTTGTFAAGKVAVNFVLLFVVSMALGLAGALLWSFIINKLPTIKNTKFSTPAALLLLYGLTEYLGFNGPLMALIFGIVLGNIDVFDRKYIEKYIPNTENIVTEKEKNFIDEIIFMLKIYFFIYVGMSIKVDDMRILMWGALITLAIFVLRVAIIKFVVSRDTPLFDKAILSIMAPKGLATAVMGGLPLAQGYADGQIIQSLLYAGLILSIIYTVILFFLADKGITMPVYRIIYGPNPSDQADKMPANH